MGTDNDIKRKVVDLLGGPVRQEVKPPRKKRAAVEVRGRGNVVGVGERVTIKHQVIERPQILPDASAISVALARQIQNMVERLVDIDEAAGVLGGERSKLFAKWYRAIKDRYEVPSYRTIPSSLGDDVVAWLARTEQTERGWLRPAARKRLAEIEARHPRPRLPG